MRNSRCGAGRAAVALLALAGAAGTAAADRAETYGRLPEISSLVIAPDGRTAAWRKTTADSDAVIIYSIAERQLVGGVNLTEDVNPSGLQFATADKLILVVSENMRIDGFRGKFDVSRAYVYNLETGKLKALLSPGGIVYTGQSGLGRIVGKSADDRYLYMPAFSGNAEAVEVPRYSLFRVSLENPIRPRMHFSGRRRSSDFFVGPDGEALVHEYFEDDGHRHVVAVRDGDDWREIYSLDTALPEIIVIGLSEDYETLVVGTYDGDTRRRSYYRMSLADGEISGKLFARADADVAAVIQDLNRVVHGARFGGFRPTYEFLDARLTARMAHIQELAAGNSVWLSDWTSDWETLVVYVEGSGFSGQYFVFGDGDEPLLSANSRPGFDNATIHPVGEFTYTASDGLSIPSLITIPRDRVDSLERLPAVMLPHGGPAAHDTVSFDWFAQALADQGYLVIQPQFRGSTGFGLDHRIAGNGEWGRKMQSDLADGVDALVKKGYVDPKRVCIVGMSYGGYAALAGGAFTPERYRCVASINGVSDLRGLVQHRKYWERDNETTMAYFAETLGGGELDLEYLDSISPAEHATNFTAPVLLVHGEDDEVVPIRQTEIMHSGLKRADKAVTFIKLDEDSHYLHTSANRVRTLRAVLDFLGQHLPTGT